MTENPEQGLSAAASILIEASSEFTHTSLQTHKVQRVKNN